MRRYQFILILVIPIMFWIGSTFALSMISKKTYSDIQFNNFKCTIEEIREIVSKDKIVSNPNKSDIERATKRIYARHDPEGYVDLAWADHISKVKIPPNTQYTHTITSSEGPFHISFVPGKNWAFFDHSNLAGLMMGILGFFINILIILYTKVSFEKTRLMEKAKNLAESKLVNQSRFYEALVENLPGVLFVKDVKNDFKYFMLNKEAEKFFGLKRENVVGKSDQEFFTADQCDFFRMIDEKTIAGREIVDIPCEVVTSSYGETLVHTRKVPIYDEHGEPEYLVGLSYDISERKRNEMELANYRSKLEHMVEERTISLMHATARAEEANRLKSEFLATMSHEIRSPMSGVLGMAELLLDTPLSEDQKGLTRTILSSGEVLMNIIEDILDFSKIEADKIEIDVVPVNMLELVDDTCFLYSAQASEKALELVVDYQAGSEYHVYADPHRVRQIIGNLVNNAIKFTQKGHIVVHVSEEKNADISSDSATLVFSIRDTGIGIATEDKEKIFEKFLQVNSSATRTYSGTGLGLAICKRLLELMGGSVHIDSEYGKGSVFTVRLTFKRNITDVADTVPKTDILKGKHVLIVDDLPIIRKMLSERLSLCGMICDVAESGAEALNIISARQKAGFAYNIILIDYLMPGMNGEMLARAIYDDPGSRETCLVMLSSAGNITSGDSLFKKGFSAFIPKPVRVSNFAENLGRIIKKFDEGYRDGLITIDSGARGTDITEDSSIDLKGAKILLVEDSRLNQAFVEEVLSQISCIVTTASNGQDALDILTKQFFDLVLMDCHMPVMDGFEAATKIRELKKDGRIQKNLPVIAFTANAMKGDRQKCLDAGMDDYVTKPVRKKELQQKILLWLRPETHLNSDVIYNQNKSMEIFQDTSCDLINIAMMEDARSILKDKFINVLDCYFMDTEDYLLDLRKAVEQNDTHALIRPAHTMKSTSRRMGAYALSALAASLESEARYAADGNTLLDFTDGRIERHVSTMMDTYTLTRKRFLELSAS